MKFIKKFLHEIPNDFAFFATSNLIFIVAFYLSLKNPFLSRWAPYLLIGLFCFTCLMLNKKFFNIIVNRYNNLGFFVSILILEIVTFSNLIIRDHQNPFLKKVALIAILTSIIFLFKNKIEKSLAQKLLIVIVPFFYITNLANYNNFISILDTSIFNFLILIAVIKLISLFDSDQRVNSGRLFQILIYALLFLMSFRSDPLFSIHGSEYHWSYYADVIATYQSGGRLLWDTPSQYGFLNIILGSIFSKDPWQSLYLFQSILLFLVSSTAFFTLHRLYGDRKYGTLFCALTTFVFFFSDPALIGPQPFPSSSVVRFGPSFLLLIALIHSLYLKNEYSWLYKNILIPLLFVVGCFWSAESLIYCLVIYLSFSFSHFLLDYRDQGKRACVSHARKLLLPFVLLLGGYLFIFIFYSLSYQIHPDISMFFMYGKYYSAGFGSLPISINGYIWTLLLPFLLLAAIFISIYKDSNQNSQFILVFTISGAIFSWFSYFIGRAVPNNIMVLSPMLIWCYLIGSYHLEKKISNLIFRIFKICSYIFIALHIGSYLVQPQFFSLFSLQKFRSVTTDISQGRLNIAPSLSGLLNEKHLSNKSLTYYGYSGTLPYSKEDVMPNSNLWLPQPFALLDEPIPHRIADRIIGRYVTKHQMNGLIVLDIKNHNQQFFQDWLNRLSRYYKCRINSENPDYRIYECEYIK